MFKLYVCIPNKEMKERIEEVCKNIYIDDKSFKFSIVKAKKKAVATVKPLICEYILVVKCSDKNIAHRRGMWFNHKFGLNYWVKEVVK